MEERFAFNFPKMSSFRILNYLLESRVLSKMPDLDTFDLGQIVGARRMGHSISEIVRQLGFSRSKVSRVYQEYMHKKLAIGQTVKDNEPWQCVVRGDSGELYVVSEAKH
ncbi:hypothetical protein TNCV_2207561 [Trichonephila clavipes]|uniref:Uncharacterized protein n=1 Tax=Trichonephila clavipes TaxID=2585209 RepID=A0A8X6S620_TRICX|nr:hypothetical protein TNCV_2207561 [Trichonephila clavipes]